MWDKKCFNCCSFTISCSWLFYTYQVNSETKVGHHSEIKSESPCEKEYKKYCMNGGECYYLVDEDIVACNCIWLNGGKRCEKYMWWT